jgi:hypothetical protein
MWRNPKRHDAATSRNLPLVAITAGGAAIALTCCNLRVAIGAGAIKP